MAKRKLPWKISFQKSSNVTKIAVLAAIILPTVAVVALNAATNAAQQDYEALRQQAAALVEQNQEMSDRVKSLGSVESAIQIAMEELGLVESDTVIIEPEN